MRGGRLTGLVGLGLAAAITCVAYSDLIFTSSAPLPAVSSAAPSAIPGTVRLERPDCGDSWRERQTCVTWDEGGWWLMVYGETRVAVDHVESRDLRMDDGAVIKVHAVIAPLPASPYPSA